MSGSRSAAVVLALALSACGTTEREGKVGDTLDGRDVAATLLEFRPEVGRRLAAVRVSLCSENEQAIGAFAFVLEYDGGKAQPVRPQPVFDDEFEVVRDRCERGWIVYAVPRGAKPTALTFAFDDTGSNQPGDHRENHLRFRWAL